MRAIGRPALRFPPCWLNHLRSGPPLRSSWRGQPATIELCSIAERAWEIARAAIVRAVLLIDNSHFL